MATYAGPSYYGFAAPAMARIVQLVPSGKVNTFTNPPTTVVNSKAGPLIAAGATLLPQQLVVVNRYGVTGINTNPPPPINLPINGQIFPWYTNH